MSNVFSIFFLLLLFNADSYTGSDDGVVVKKWVIEKNSSLNIQGETNVNSFQCGVKEYLNADTLFYIHNAATNKLSFKNSFLSIDIRRFDCHNKFITSDFRNALKADEYPALRIIFISLDQFTNPSDNQLVKGIVDVALADVNKRSEICFRVKTLTHNRIELTGSHSFTFSDFKLKAPRKMAGLIRTRDKIEVNFKLFFKAI